MENPVSADSRCWSFYDDTKRKVRTSLLFAAEWIKNTPAWCAPDADPVTTNTNTGLMPPLLLTTVTPLKRHLDTLHDEKLHQVRRMAEAVVSS